MAKNTNFMAPKEPHHRNIYKTLPDIEQLAAEFPEFQKKIKQAKINKEIRFTIDYTDRDHLRALTQVLMKRDFKLDIDLPNDKFVPIVPMRLNYLLWIEDLLELPAMKTEHVYGIDIGKGASCLYALLAAKKNNWHMLTSESDDITFRIAKRNIEVNELKNLVLVNKVDENVCLNGLLTSEVIFDFCMFNPPVMCEQDAQIMAGKRQIPGKASLKLIPKNELPDFVKKLTKQGEGDFIKNRLIEDSKKFKDCVRIFSSMVGHRRTIDELLPQLIQLVGKKHVCISGFTIGKLTRWGIAWTFDRSIEFENTGEEQIRDQGFKTRQLTWNNILLPEAVERVKYMLDCAKIMHKIIETTNNSVKLEITAFEGMYSISSKDFKRKIKRESWTNVKKVKLENCDKSYDYEQPSNSSYSSGNCSDHQKRDDPEFKSAVTKLMSIPLDDNRSSSYSPSCKMKVDDDENEIRQSFKNIAVQAALQFTKSSDQRSVIIQAKLLSGRAQWNGLHQILTFLNLNWKDS